MPGEIIKGEDRRISVSVFRTIKVGRPEGMEFTKFNVAEEVTIPEDQDPALARRQLFTNLLNEAAVYESVVKAAGGNENKINQIIRLLARILENQGGEADGQVKENRHLVHGHSK